MKRAVIVVGLLIIVLANFIMVYYAPYGISIERFQNGFANSGEYPPASNGNSGNGNSGNGNGNNSNNSNNSNNRNNNNVMEGFSSYALENSGGAKDGYQPMGQYDGVKLSTGNSVSEWRYTAPNEPLTGAEFVPGDNDLFMFKNNQCKPECCGASFSCGGGCVCTTPQQRQYIAGRGGNRTEPEDGL